MLRTLIASCAMAGALLCTAGAAQASLIVYTTSLSGAAESPPQASSGIGFASVAIDDVANIMNIQVTFSGLTGTTTMSHIHCCTAAPGAGNIGVATETPTFSLFPLGVQSGTFFESYDLTQATTYNPPFLTANGNTAAGAEAALLAGLAGGRAYLNIHTTFAPGGEIRGFLTVPEPTSWTLMILGFGALGATLRRRRATTALA